jgi:hypothetical protein
MRRTQHPEIISDAMIAMRNEIFDDMRDVCPKLFTNRNNTAYIPYSGRKIGISASLIKFLRKSVIFIPIDHERGLYSTHK